MAIPTMTLRTVNYRPAVFTPGVYDYESPDINIFRKGLSDMEARMNNAAQAQTQVDQALGKIESSLHRDPETDAWFADYKQDINNQIQALVNAGDYGAAYRTAVQSASKVLSDTPVIGRIRANAEFEKEVETQRARVQKGEISQATYNWWSAQEGNNFHYEDIKDDNGNIIGGTPWTPSNLPVADLNVPAVATAMFKMITPDKGQSKTGGATNLDANGNPLTVTSSGHRGSSFERVRTQDILDRMQEYLISIPDGFRQAEQLFNVAKYDYEKSVKEYQTALENGDPNAENLRQQLAKRERLLTQRGVFVDYDTYFARVIIDDLYAKGLAYDWRTSDTEDNKMFTPAKTGGGRSRGDGEEEDDGQGVHPYDTTYGPQVEFQWHTTYDRPTTAKSAATNAGNKLKPKRN